MSKLTVKQAAHWISEAWGRPIGPGRCRLRGNWLFVKDPNENDIDCIHNPKGGDIWGEPWTNIPEKLSPFNPDWDKSILKTLDDEISDYLGRYESED